MTQAETTTIISDGFYRILLDEKDFIFRIKMHDQDDRSYPGEQVIAKVRKFGSRTMHNIGWIDEGQLKRNGVRWTDPAYDALLIKAANMIVEGDEAAREQAGQFYAKSFGRCYVCNRELTHADSLATGIGPECSDRRKHLELWDEDHEARGQEAEAAHLAAIRKRKREKKIILADHQLEGKALIDTIFKRGRPIVVQSSKEGWQLAPNEYRYPGVKPCNKMLPDQKPPICREPAIWRTHERSYGAGRSYSIGHYCDEHLPSEVREAFNQGTYMLMNEHLLEK